MYVRINTRVAVLCTCGVSFPPLGSAASGSLTLTCACFRVWWLGVWGLGFGVGFGFWGLGCKGLGFRVQVTWFGVEGLGFRV
jgi:hypothetical protein